MTIFTLTLNPVIDVHFSVNGLRIGAENYTRSMIKIAAGKGVNISRALKRHGVSAPAFVLSGANSADIYANMLFDAGIEAVFHTVPGNIREYVSINDLSGETETRVCYRDFSACDDDVLLIGSMLTERLSAGDIVCISGGLPYGVSPDAVAALSDLFRSRGAYVVIDCAALDADSLRRSEPWLIKPNLSEARALLCICGELPDIDADRSGIARRLTELAQNVLLSLGPDGAIFASRAGALVSLPAVPISHCYSTVGAGDNLLAGFLFALSAAGFSGNESISASLAETALRSGLTFAAEQCSEKR